MAKNGEKREGSQDYAGMLNAISDPIIMVSAHDVILYANEAARKVLAGVSGDITGVKIQSLLSDACELHEAPKLYEGGDENVVRDRKNVVWGVRKQFAEFCGNLGQLYQFRKIPFHQHCLDTIRSTHPNPSIYVKLPAKEDEAPEIELNKAAKIHFPDFEQVYLPDIVNTIRNMEKEGTKVHQYTLKEEGGDGFRYTQLDIVLVADQQYAMVYGTEITDIVEMAEYPKYNPNPILRFGINDEGISIIYCNPAAFQEFPYLVQHIHPSIPSGIHSKKNISLHRLDRHPAELFENLSEIIDKLKGENKRANFIREICVNPPEGNEKHYEQKIAWDPGNPNVAITYLSDITARKRLIAELEYMQDILKEETIRDPLTGLFNRRYLERIMQSRIHEAMRYGDNFGLLMVDIDHFKQYNDEHSHIAGDEVLRAVAKSLTNALRASDIICRYGGEEFVIILPRTHLDGIEECAERCRKTIENNPKIIFNNKELPSITISIGGVSVALEGEPTKINVAKEVEMLIGFADKELQRAKRGGRNRVCVRMTLKYTMIAH